jgi:hypothetical protein
MVEPVTAPAAPVQRRATVNWKDRSLDKENDAAAAVEFLKEALHKPWGLLGLLPGDLLRPQQDTNAPLIQSTMANLFNDAKDHGSFDLSDKSDLQRLTGLLVQTHRASAIGVSAHAGSQPAVVSVGRNTFQVVEKPKEELEQTLALWNAYYQYKMAQYDAIREAHPAYYSKLSKLASFKNFDNLGTMLGTVSDISSMTPKQIHDKVRVAINPTAPDRIAAILIYSDRPTEQDTFPAYVQILVANPKTIKPDRREGDYKQKKSGLTDPTVRGKGRAVLPEASGQRGAGNTLLQHAVLESGPNGIELWPLDDTTEAIYLGMDFDGAKFEPKSDGHLLLKPKDMKRFAAHATGSLKETIGHWRTRYG